MFEIETGKIFVEIGAVFRQDEGYGDPGVWGVTIHSELPDKVVPRFQDALCVVDRAFFWRRPGAAP